MGWLGWTEAQTLDMTPDAIRLAREGRLEMINAVLKAVFPPAPSGAPAGHTSLAEGHKLAPTGENLRIVFRSLADEKPE